MKTKTGVKDVKTYNNCYWLFENMNTFNYTELKRHIGHNIACVGYALQDKQSAERLSEYQNVAIECEDCNEVLVSYDK